MSLFHKQIVVIGSSESNEKLNSLAYETGKEIAKAGYILVCGGKEGVMEAASKGVKESGGMTVGIIPDEIPEGGNEYLDIVIPTGIGHARNYIVQNSGISIIMIGGSHGTLSELAYALKFKRKIISLGSDWGTIDKNIIIAKDPRDAVKKAIND